MSCRNPVGRSSSMAWISKGPHESSIAAALGISEATASRALRAARTEFIRRLRDSNPELLEWFLQSTKRRATEEATPSIDQDHEVLTSIARRAYHLRTEQKSSL